MHLSEDTYSIQRLDFLVELLRSGEEFDLVNPLKSGIMCEQRQVPVKAKAGESALPPCQ